MKIILEAFGHLKSAPMDVPENTSPTFKMMLAQGKTPIVGYSGQEIGTIEPLWTICEFEWTGETYVLTDQSTAKRYVLRDIIKRGRDEGN